MILDFVLAVLCPFDLPPPQNAPVCIDYDEAAFEDCNEARLDAYEQPYSMFCSNWSILQTAVSQDLEQCLLDHPGETFTCMSQVFAQYAAFYDRLFVGWQRSVFTIEYAHGTCLDALCP